MLILRWKTTVKYKREKKQQQNEPTHTTQSETHAILSTEKQKT